MKERIEYTKTYVNFDEAYLSAFYDQVLILSQIRTKALKLDIMITMNRLSHQRSLRLHNRYWRKEEERRDSELMANVRS